MPRKSVLKVAWRSKRPFESMTIANTEVCQGFELINGFKFPGRTNKRSGEGAVKRGPGQSL
jgi:hypothetical protein